MSMSRVYGKHTGKTYNSKGIDEEQNNDGEMVFKQSLLFYMIQYCKNNL